MSTQIPTFSKLVMQEQDALASAPSLRPESLQHASLLEPNQQTSRLRKLSPYFRSCCYLLLLLATGPGCAALHAVRGVPASYLPQDFHGPSRDDKRTIDPSLLVRTPPDQHRVAAGDVLAIYLPGVLGPQSSDVTVAGLQPPINMPSTITDPPTVGYPIQVRDDHTISLPQIPPLNVYNMTLHEVEEALRRAYTVDNHILRPDEALVMVSLQRPRVHRVLVVRQEANNGLSIGSGPGQLNVGTTGKGMAREVVLRAYENDVLHALSRAEGGADGLPGLNAENTIYVIRRRQKPNSAHQQTHPAHQQSPIPAAPYDNNLPAPHLSAVTPAMSAAGFSQWPQQFQPENGQRGVQQASYQTESTPWTGHSAAGIPSGHSASSGASPYNGGQLPAGMSPYASSPIAPTPAAGHSFGSSHQMPHSLPAPQYSADGLASADWGAGQGWPLDFNNLDATIDNPNIIKIPIRIDPGQNPRITEDQITLYDGDIVFIESRETEVFYTGGLLGGGQYTLPRDYNLGVLEAISIAESRSGGAGNLNKAIGGVSALNKDVANSASRLVILRTLPNKQRVPIEIDLHRAMKYKEENIIIQPGDMLILEYTFPEAVSAFTQRFLMEGALIGVATTMMTQGGGGR